MEDIAVGAGITVGSLYHHFASKKDLFEAVLSRQADDLLGVLTAAVDQVESFGPRLVSLLEAARRLHTSRARAVFVAILPAQTVENPELAPLARRHGTGFRRLYERMVDDAVARGELPTALGREEVVGMLASFVSGLGSASAANPDPSAFGGIIDAYRALIDGLFAGSGPGSILVDGRKSNPT